MIEFTGFDYDQATDRAIETANSLIDFYDLHRNPLEPVFLGGILDKFDIRFMELPETTHGFTLDIDHKIIIALNNKLSADLTRYVAMHEVGHVACWHPNQLNNCIQGQWLYNRLETEATTVAAYLLIPRLGVDDLFGESLEDIARRYIVPRELVNIRRALFRLKGS